MVLVQIPILDCLLHIFSDLMYNFKLHWQPCFKKTGSLMAATGNFSYSSSSRFAKVSELNSLQNVPLVKPSPNEERSIWCTVTQHSIVLVRVASCLGPWATRNPVWDQPTDSTFHALECSRSKTLFMDFLSRRSGPTGLAWYVTSSMLHVPAHSFCIHATIRACKHNY